MHPYLFFDLLGKFLILASVGLQLLWLAPLTAERDQTRQDLAMGLSLSNHQVNMVQLKAGEDEENVRTTIALQWKNLRESGMIRYAIPAKEIGYARWGVIVAFVLGTISTMLATYLEKRNKPAP